MARALTVKETGALQARVLRQALFSWTFNPATRDADSPPEVTGELGWAERASLPVAELEDTATVRLALGGCAVTWTPVTFAGVTQAAGIPRSWLYTQPDISSQICRLPRKTDGAGSGASSPRPRRPAVR